MFDPSSFQPLVPYFDLNIGGLSRIYQDPNIPVEARFTVSNNGAMSDLQITLFDEAGWEVEPYIWQSARDQGIAQGTFQFGWKGSANIDSDLYNFQMNNYTVSWENNAFSITMFCNIIITPLISNNQASGTVKEVIEKIAGMHNLQVEYYPEFGTQYMMEKGLNDVDSTAKREIRVSKNQDESDWSYLNRVLEYARDQQGKGGYRPLVTTKDGKNVLQIIMPQQTGSTYQYTVQDEKSVVISWKPAIDFSPVLDVNDIDHNTVMRSTGEPMKIKLHQNVTLSFQETFGQDVTLLQNSVNNDQKKPDQLVYRCPESMPDEVVNGNVRSRMGGTASPHAGVNQPLVFHLRRWFQGQQAELTIVGDPQVMPKPGATCDVYFYYPINYLNSNVRQLHYTSGTYWVNEVVHQIGIGHYETILRLERCAADETPAVISTGAPQQYIGDSVQTGSNIA